MVGMCYRSRDTERMRVGQPKCSDSIGGGAGKRGAGRQPHASSSASKSSASTQQARSAKSAGVRQPRHQAPQPPLPATPAPAAAGWAAGCSWESGCRSPRCRRYPHPLPETEWGAAAASRGPHPPAAAARITQQSHPRPLVPSCRGRPRSLRGCPPGLMPRLRNRHTAVRQCGAVEARLCAGMRESEKARRRQGRPPAAPPRARSCRCPGCAGAAPGPPGWRPGPGLPAQSRWA